MDANEYELERQRNIQRNQELLQRLDLGVAVKSPRTASPKPSQPKPKKKQIERRKSGRLHRPVVQASRALLDLRVAVKSRRTPSRKPRQPKPKKKEIERWKSERLHGPKVQTSRTLRSSSRLQDIEAYSVVAKRKAETEGDVPVQANRPKRRRIEGDLLLKNIMQVGKDGRGLDELWKDAESILNHVTGTQNALQYINCSETDNSAARDLATIRKAMGKLRLFDKWTPNEIKITPDRIYSLQMFPTPDRRIVLAGDKLGNLGIWDVDGSRSDPDNEDDEKATELPLIHQFKLHASTISSFVNDPHSIQKLYTASYDSTIRSLDLVTGVSTEIYVPELEDGEAWGPLLSGVELYPNGNIMIFSNTNGSIGRRDLRQPPASTNLYDLHEAKIGGISLHPLAPHLLVTSSLDRTMKLWDLRKISGSKSWKSSSSIGEYNSPLSVSCAYWNKDTIVATSYDDTIRIFPHQNSVQWPVDHDLGIMKPEYTIKHDNQTGRWVTIFRARWHQNPASGLQKFVVGNMKRSIDIYSDTGDLLAQLSDPEKITAVPAVCQFHPTQEWLAGGTASGKICAFFPSND
ncbi:DNA damage-binding protein CMR1 [Neolecta irregularis DAH-3]|uniref:DNA damage-binding protein CMR1 n=1 Tax=Neolecta irregularis (strain DAH-3) TaxID=1198029 RepID=A0A1U7LSJ5_NEOID|nr:DNA damage-binding protein CMR1 [Neolecta irregularis DAH-3]|eukprot:OLL25599.1 DNA damage-binding protein CMR1 [Neolecta irregularis DAH-3]